MKILAEKNEFRALEISEPAYKPQPPMCTVWAVDSCRPEWPIMLFWIKKHLDHFFRLATTSKEGEKSVSPGCLL